MTAEPPASTFTSRAYHHLDLERATVQALERADFRLAFALADRRCRILPHPDARIHLLRAEALYNLDLKEAALESVARTLELEPDDLVAARRMIAWGSGTPQVEAALTVAKLDTDLETIKNALLRLQRADQDSFARVDPLDREVTGWATWQAPGEVRLTLTSPDQSQSISLIPDPRHRLAARDRHAANFRIARPPSTRSQRLRITQGDRLIADVQIPANRVAVRAGPARAKPQVSAAGGVPFLTVIVPVYGDLAATQACLDSALRAVTATPSSKVVIVDDASPEPGIRSLLSNLAARPEVTLLTNNQNLGFVGSVNRALGETPDGDIVLLNSDTLVPEHALERLRAAVCSTPGVGTATPLSNNGEFTSFPVANKSNPLPRLDRVEELDRLAEAVNAGSTIDIPNGIGFCLYITRECLDAVSELSDDFYRGYLEDVDLCLRAAEAGFRNICVPSVFVGHEGSRSFLGEKRSLVMRNLRVLEQRYPRYAAECAAFLLADPLRDSRAALERAILPAEPDGELHLVLSGDGAGRDIAIERCRQLEERAKRGLAIHFHSDGSHLLARIVNPTGDLPQSIEFDVAESEGKAAFLQFLADLSPRSLEIAEPARIPQSVLKPLQQCFPYDILLTDASLAAKPERRSGVHSDWQSLVGGARQVIAIDRRGLEFGEAVLGLRPQREMQAPKPLPVHQPRTTTACLGVLALRNSAQEFRFIRQLSDHLARAHSAANLVVLGTTLDDVGLMQRSNVMVTGKIGIDDVGTLVEAHGIGKLLLDAGDPLFGHPLTAAFETTKLPIAAVEWAAPQKRIRKKDLRLLPELAENKTIEAIVDWLIADHD